MSDPELSSDNVANHTLTLLRRIDKRIDEMDKRFVHIVDILSRQQTRLDRIERDVREAKFDLVVMENNILNRLTEGHFMASRINDMDERLIALEQASRSSSAPQ